MSREDGDGEKLPAASSAPECMCKKPAKRLACHKEGPNKDRPFWTCASRFCNFFESADGKPWIRGRVVGDEFRPFKKYRLADSSIKEVYSRTPTLKRIPVDRRGMEFLDRILAKEEQSENLTARKKTADAITAMRIYPCLKIVRGLFGGFAVKKKLPPKPGVTEGKSSGYKFFVADIHDTERFAEGGGGRPPNWELDYADPRDEECVRLVCEFISGLATDPAKVRLFCKIHKFF